MASAFLYGTVIGFGATCLWIRVCLSFACPYVFVSFSADPFGGFVLFLRIPKKFCQVYIPQITPHPTTNMNAVMSNDTGANAVKSYEIMDYPCQFC